MHYNRATMVAIRFICLANSRKLGGRCVAGVRADSLAWVRPVSSDPKGTLHGEYRLGDGTDAAIFDVIEVDVVQPRPQPHQPENWELGGAPWRRVEHLSPADAHAAVNKIVAGTGPLLGNTSDRVTRIEIATNPPTVSRALIAPTATEWERVPRQGRAPQIRCRFALGTASYDLSVTDPIIEAQLADLEPGWHSRLLIDMPLSHRLLLVVSLAEPYEQADGSCFKLISAVIGLPPL